MRLSEPGASRPQHDGFDGDSDKKLAAGAATNLLGILAKSLHPLFLVLATRLYGPTAVGVYVLATTIFELVTGVVSSGWRDAVLLVGGRHAGRHDPEQEGKLYAGLGQALQAVVLGSLAVTALALLAGAPLLQWLFPDVDVWTSLLWLLPSLPLLCVAEIAIAGTRAIMVMRYDALVLGLLKPGAMVLAALALWPLWPDPVGLAASFTAAHVLVLIAAVIAFRRHFSLARTLSAALRTRPSRDLWAFAIPQSLNMTLNYFTTGIDVLVLGHYGVGAERIAFYATANRIIRNVRQVKLGFSGAFNPLIARWTADGQIAALEAQFATVARWVATIAHPLLLLSLVFRGELLMLFHPSYAQGSSFMLLLAIPPLMSSIFGLAGNVIVMAGHSRYNLLNSIVVVVATLGSAIWLVPRFEIYGAAAASALAAVIITALQVTQMRRLVGARLLWRALAAPQVAGLCAAAGATLIWFGSPATLPAALMHTASAIVGLGVYALVLRALGLPPEDRHLLRPWARERPAAPETP